MRMWANFNIKSGAIIWIDFGLRCEPIFGIKNWIYFGLKCGLFLDQECGPILIKI